MANSGGFTGIDINVGNTKYTVNKAQLKELTNITSSYDVNEYTTNNYNNDIYNDAITNVITLEELKNGEVNTSNNESKNVVNNSNNKSIQPSYDEDYTFWEKVELEACKTICKISNTVDKLLDAGGPVTDYAATAVQSFSCGVLGVFEDIGDGIIMAGGMELASLAEKSGNDELANDIKNITTDAIDDDWSEELYQENVKTLGVDEDIANGKVHTIGSMAGSIVTYITTGNVLAGFMPLIGMSASMGSSSEVALQSGATFEETSIVSTVSGLIGFVTGGLTDKFGANAASAETMKQVFKYGGVNALASMTEPIVNSITEYFVYGKDMVNEDGTKKYDNIADYYKESGGLLNTIFAGLAGGGTTILGGLKGRNNVKVDTETTTKVETDVDVENVTDVKNKSTNKLKDAMTYETYYKVNGNTVEDNVLEIIKRHDAKYGDGSALNQLVAYIDPQNPQYGNPNLISSANDARDILQLYTPEQINHALNNLSSNTRTGYFSRYGSSANANFGVDQGGIASLCEYKYNDQIYTYDQAMYIYNDALNNGKPLPHFEKKGNAEYFYLKEKLMAQGLSSKDASIVMSTVDDAGACSYAATANEIFASFQGKEFEFEQKFGFPMYKTENGKVVLNSNELLLDMYVHCNSLDNGGGFILPDGSLNPNLSLNNRHDVFGRQMLDAQNQTYMSTLQGGKNNYSISSYLNSKGVTYDSKWMYSNPNGVVIDDSTFNSWVNQISNEMNSGKAISLGIYQFPDANGNIMGNTINMNSTNPNLYNSVSTQSWKEGGGHAIFVTDIGSDCFYVSSWGREYSIPFDDLKNGGIFNVYSSNIY